MKKHFLFVILASVILTPHRSYAAAITTETLKIGCDRYIDMLNLAGKSDQTMYQKALPIVMSPQCQKIINGKLAVSNIKQLDSQLQDVHKMAGNWDIQPLDVIASSTDKTCVIRYILNSKSKGHFTTIAILRFDDNGRIKEINEVWNTYDAKS